MQHILGHLATVLIALVTASQLGSGQPTTDTDVTSSEGCDSSLIKALLEGQRELKSQIQQQRCSGKTETDSVPNHGEGILVHQNFGSAPHFFNRSWAEFKVGFGNLSGKYWIGNDRLHQLTKDGRYKLRVDLHATFNGRWYWAEYDRFIVGNESTSYRLSISGYSGDAGDAMTVDGYHTISLNNMKFSTYDRDNDMASTYHCALWNSGFWYNRCTYAHMHYSRWWSLPIGPKFDPDADSTSKYIYLSSDVSRMRLLQKAA